MTAIKPNFADNKPVDWDEKQIALGASFMQSGLWAEFQTKLGRRPHFLMSPDWSCLLIERQTPLGNYLFAPYGPTLQSADQLAHAVKEVRNYAKQNGFDWLIIEPVALGESAVVKSALPNLGARRSSHNREPELSRVIDLTPYSDDILASISQSTRSLIRKNQREHFLTFKTSADPGDMSVFIKMLQAVTSRNSVFFFPDDYFHKQAETLMPPGMLKLEMALSRDKPVAAALFHDYGSVSSYSFGASLPEARQTSASALLLYQSMLNAKQRGMAKMDLFGIAPENAPDSHPWSGFSSFKKKFGGQVVTFAGAWDIPLSPRYRLYRAAQAARRLRRRH